MVEKDILEKCKISLKEAVDDELMERLNHAKINIRYVNKISNQPGAKIMDSGEINKNGDFNRSFQDMLILMERPYKIRNIENLFKNKIVKNIGIVPQYNVRIVDENTRFNETKRIVSKGYINNDILPLDSIYQNGTCKIYDLICANTIFVKLDSNHSVELTLTSPTSSVITRAKYIFIISLFLVLLIGIILVLQFKSMMREKAFTAFMKDYTRILVHELRSPVNNIYLLTSRLLSKDVLENEKIVHYHQECLNQCSKLLLGIDNILLVAKAEQAELQVTKTLTNMNAFIGNIVEKYNVRALFNKTISITTEYRPETCNAFIDPDLMENVMTNLIENAIKYSGEAVDIRILCKIENNNLQISVKDNGIGISASDIENIFNIFERGEKSEDQHIKGFGIGLYYVQKVIKAHQGEINVKSTEGSGCEFTINIPIL